jgi:MFS family permease
MTPTHSLRRSRIGVTAVFFLLGFVFATWVVNIPAVQRQTGLSHPVLGTLLLLLAAGSILSMQITGRLASRIRPRVLLVGGLVVFGLGVNLPGLAHGSLALAGALFVFGIGNGILEVMVNDLAVRSERAHGRPIMSSFHAFYSIGGAAGAGIAAVCQVLDVGLTGSLAIATVVCAVVAPFAVIGIGDVRDVVLETGTAGSGDTTSTGSESSRAGRVVILAVLAFALLLAEGTANDWSALHAVQHLHQSESSASLAYFVFAIFMTAGRLSADKVAAKFGPVAVVRFGSGIAAAGILVVVASTWYPLTIVGWSIFGIGLSGIVPQVFTAGGNLPGPNRSVALARIVGAAYAGTLGGPALIGWVSGITGLNTALLLPGLFCLVGVVAAGSVRPQATRGYVDGSKKTAPERETGGSRSGAASGER